MAAAPQVADYGLNDLMAGLRTADTAAASTVHHPFGSPAGPGLFHHKGLQLPAYIQNVAHALTRKGLPEEVAIPHAVGIVRDWSEGHDGHGHSVHADVQAAAAKAIAEWEADKTGGRSLRFNPYHAPAGAGGGEFTSAGGGGGGSKASASKAGHGKTAPAHGSGHGRVSPPMKHVSGTKGELLERAAADRKKAHELETELKSLEQQLKAHSKLAPKAKTTKIHTHVQHKQHTAATHKHAAKAKTLRQRISSLREQISTLNAQADQLAAQAKAM